MFGPVQSGTDTQGWQKKGWAALASPPAETAPFAHGHEGPAINYARLAIYEFLLRRAEMDTADAKYARGRDGRTDPALVHT